MEIRDRGRPQYQLKNRFTWNYFDEIFLDYPWRTYKRNDHITITVSILPGENAIWSNGTKITGIQIPVCWIRQPLQNQDQLTLPMRSYASTVRSLTTLQFIDATNLDHIEMDDRPRDDEGGRLSGSEHIISKHMGSS